MIVDWQYEPVYGALLHVDLKRIAMDERRIEDAIAEFERAIALGEKLFPPRLAKKHFWTDGRTRPFIRGLRSLATAYVRAGRYDDALTTCERLEHHAADSDSAAYLRSEVLLNLGRYEEAAAAALRIRQIWPSHSFIAGFARSTFEQAEGSKKTVFDPLVARLIPAMNASTRSRATSSWIWRGGDFMKYAEGATIVPPRPRSSASRQQRMASMTTPALFGESHTSSFSSRLSGTSPKVVPSMRM